MNYAVKPVTTMLLTGVFYHVVRELNSSTNPLNSVFIMYSVLN